MGIVLCHVAAVTATRSAQFSLRVSDWQTKPPPFLRLPPNSQEMPNARDCQQSDTGNRQASDQRDRSTSLKPPSRALTFCLVFEVVSIPVPEKP